MDGPLALTGRDLSPAEARGDRPRRRAGRDRRGRSACGSRRRQPWWPARRGSADARLRGDHGSGLARPRTGRRRGRRGVLAADAARPRHRRRRAARRRARPGRHGGTAERAVRGRGRARARRVADGLAALLNAGVHPRVPRSGSVGAADLCLLAHVGLALIGEGEAELGGEWLPAAQALHRAGLSPVPLGPKDGLAICSSSAVVRRRRRAGAGRRARRSGGGAGVGGAFDGGVSRQPQPARPARRCGAPGARAGVGGGGAACDCWPAVSCSTTVPPAGCRTR